MVGVKGSAMSVRVEMVCRHDSRSERGGLCLVFIVYRIECSERVDGTLTSGLGAIPVIGSPGGVVEDVFVFLSAILILLCLAKLRS